MKNIQETRRTH